MKVLSKDTCYDLFIMICVVKYKLVVNVISVTTELYCEYRLLGHHNYFSLATRADFARWYTVYAKQNFAFRLYSRHIIIIKCRLF